MEKSIKTVLLVEDEVIIALATRKQLEKAGYHVVQAINGDKALELVRGETIDLILMDIDLGAGIDGTEAAREILKNQDIPILFLSSHIEKDIVEKTEQITNYGYVVKNSSFTVLDASIKMAFKLFDAHMSINTQKMEITAAYEEMQVSNEELMHTQSELLEYGSVLKESEERYHSLFIEMREAFALHEIVCDEKGHPVDYLFLDINPAFEKLTGLNKADTIGKSVLSIMPETEKYWIETYGRVALSGESVDFEQYSVELDKWYSVAAFCPRKGQFAVLFSDITERKRSTEDLKKERTVLQMIMETSPVGIATTDKDGNITYANSRAEKILGLSKDTITSRSYNAPSWHPTGLDGKPYPNELQPFYLVKKGQRSVFDIRHAIDWPDGTRVVLSVNASPLLDADGIFYGMVATFEDISERMAAETALKKSEEKAKNLLAEKELVLKEVHHRIKNNMTMMSSLMNLQSDTQDNPETKSILQDASARLGSMTVLYNLLYQTENIQGLSLREYLTSLVTEIENIFHARETVKFDLQAGDMAIDAKILSPLGIIVNELVTNSMKYAFSGRSSGEIRIKATRADNHVTLEYSDGGPGIPESAFNGESSGLGLQLIKLLVEQIKGSIRLEREAGSRCLIEFES